MGKVLSSIKHPFRNFNLESRVDKVISQAKPKPAPKYEKDQELIDKLKAEDKATFEASLKKNAELDERLKDIYVTSHDPVEIKQEQNPNRPLPTDKKQPETYLFGFKEPERIPYGKTTLRNALQFITNHQSEPEIYTAKKIAEDHKLNECTVETILKYYKVFQIYIPNEIKPKAKFAGPSLPKVVIIKSPRKQLPEPQSDSKKDET